MTHVTIDTERVWAQMHTSLHAFVNRRVRQPADADDIVQRVFLQLHRSVPTLRDADRIHAWLYQTARCAIADFYRSPVNRREMPAGDAVDVVGEGGGAGIRDDEVDASAHAELAQCLQPLLGTLTDVDREALQLVEIDDLSQADAARRLGLSLSGMKSRVQRARARLRTVVEQCCRVDLDRRGGVIAYEARSAGSCEGCAPAPGSRAACRPG